VTAGCIKLRKVELRQHEKVESLTIIAGNNRCEIDSLLPRGGFSAYIPWRASDVLCFEVTVDGKKARFPIELPPGRIVSGPWSHAQPAEPRTDIFGCDELGRAWSAMVDEVNAKGLTVCEVGSRNVTGNPTKRTAFPGASKYIGMDVHLGENVDVVGDAHYLHDLIGEAIVGCIFSCVVLEHLSYPWLFAASVNRALKTGGLTFHLTHQTWPIHEEPNDFFRFSDAALRVLFGPEMGFETLYAGMHNRAFVYPEERRQDFAGLSVGIAYTHSFVLARKVKDIAPDAVRWPVARENAGKLATLYPNRA
jgi:hypothetical protein